MLIFLSYKIHLKKYKKITHRGIIPRGHDWRVGGVAGPGHPGAVLHGGEHRALRAEAAGGGHGAAHGLGADTAGLPQQPHLGLGLDHPQVVQRGPG